MKYGTDKIRQRELDAPVACRELFVGSRDHAPRTKYLDSFALSNQRKRERGLAKESSLAGDRCRFGGETGPLEFFNCGPFVAVTRHVSLTLSTLSTLPLFFYSPISLNTSEFLCRLRLILFFLLSQKDPLFLNHCLVYLARVYYKDPVYIKKDSGGPTMATRNSKGEIGE